MNTENISKKEAITNAIALADVCHEYFLTNVGLKIEENLDTNDQLFIYDDNKDKVFDFLEKNTFLNNVKLKDIEKYAENSSMYQNIFEVEFMGIYSIAQIDLYFQNLLKIVEIDKQFQYVSLYSIASGTFKSI